MKQQLFKSYNIYNYT